MLKILIPFCSIVVNKKREFSIYFYGFYIFKMTTVWITGIPISFFSNKKIGYYSLSLEGWNFLCFHLNFSLGIPSLVTQTVQFRLLFTNLTRPICLVYSTFVWINTLLVLNPIIHWTSSDRWCPRWYGQTIYSLPAISVLFESFISSHETHGYWKPVRYSILSYLTFGL